MERRLRKLNAVNPDDAVEGTLKGLAEVASEKPRLKVFQQRVPVAIPEVREKKAENYEAMLRFVCAIIAFRAAGLLG